MRNVLKIGIVLITSASIVSCFDKDKPNFQFMPNMYEPVGYEAYGSYDIFPDQQEAMLPAPGSIPRGWEPYDYEDTTEGLNLAKTELQNPLEVTDENLATGAQLYTIYCAVCHGDAGDGKGILAQREKFLGIPSYADPGRNITIGGIYHVEMYGLNNMGSYASQTNSKERWQIAMHVMNLKAALNGEPQLAVKNVDTTATGMVQTMEQKPAEVNNTSREKTN